MAQFGRPDNDDANVGVWDDEIASGATLFTSIDEPTTPNDSDFVRSPGKPIDSELYTCGVSAVTDPAVSTGHIVRYRVGKNATGNIAMSAVVRLLDNVGGTVASWSHTDTALNTLTTYNQTLSGAQADALAAADYAGGWAIEFDPVVSGGGPNRFFDVTWAEIEVPDAAGATPISVAATATGTAAVGRQGNLIVAQTATGTADIIRKGFLNIVATATGTADVIRKALLIVAQTVTGTPGVTFKNVFPILVAATATGTANVLRTGKLLVGQTATGTVAVVRKSFLLIVGSTATGTAGVVRKAQLIVAQTVTGTPGVSLRNVVTLLIAATATGTAAVTRTGKLLVNQTATATVGLLRIAQLALSVTVTGTSGLVRMGQLIVAQSVTGTANVVRQGQLAMSLTATGTAAVVRKSQLLVQVTATGTAAVIRKGLLIIAQTAAATAGVVVNFIPDLALALIPIISFIGRVARSSIEKIRGKRTVPFDSKGHRTVKVKIDLERD